MTSSLRDALRQSGVLDQFKPVERRNERPAKKADGRGRPAGRKNSQGKGDAPRAPRQRTDEEMDLAKAYACARKANSANASASCRPSARRPSVVAASVSRWRH